MPSKGVTKTGDAFCMSCGAGVEPGAARCESCYSQLDEEVKAFRCPRCGKILELGTDQCPRCSMKFKVKTIRPSDAAQDDEMLTRLIDWGRSGTPESTASVPAQEEVSEGRLTDEESEALSSLLYQMSELADLRAEVASGMGTSLSEARERISRLNGKSPSELPVEDLESELRAISQDVSRVTELLSRTRAFADIVNSTVSMPGVTSLLEGRKVLVELADASGGVRSSTEDELADREEQVRKREEMVDRKIAAYAAKKKQLESLEKEIESRGTQASPEPSPDPRSEEQRAQLEALARKAKEIHLIVSEEGASDDPEPCLASLDEHVRSLVTAKSELEQNLAQLKEGEDEVKALLKTLDNLLGQLPAEAIDRFSNSEEFKLYERVLDRMKI